MQIPLALKIVMLQRMIAERSIEYQKTRKGGIHSQWRLNLKSILLDPDLLEILVECFWSLYEDDLPFQVCGVEFAAVPLVTGILLEGRRRGFDVSGFIVRRERKSDGTGRLVEGTISDKPVICVDDILNSGNSAQKVSEIVKRSELKFSSLFTVVDFRSARGLRWRKRNKVRVRPLFHLSDFGLRLSRSERVPALKKRFEIVWQFCPIPSKASFAIARKATPEIYDGRLFFATDDALVYALDAVTGEERWRFKVQTAHAKGIWASPLLIDGAVVIGAYDGNLYRLEAATGREVWRSRLAEWIGSSACYDPVRNSVLVGIELALPRRKGALVSVSMDNGEILWSFALDAYQHGSPAVSDKTNAVYFGNNSGEFFCLDARSGEVIWRTIYSAAPIKGAPELDVEGKRLAFGNSDGDVFVLATENGSIKYHFKVGGEVYSKPLLMDNRCFVTCTDKNLYVFDLSKNKLGTTIALGSRSFTAPVRVGESIIVGTASGAVAEIDTQTLKITSAVHLLEPVAGEIRYESSSQLYYVLGAEGQMFALKLVDE